MRRKFRIHVLTINRKVLILLAIIILSIVLISLFRNFEVFKVMDDTIVIDPGHGGIDGGTGNKDDVLEKDINLEAGLKLRRVLEKEGFQVVMTREKDESLEQYSEIKGSRYARDLNARKTIINKSDPALFVSIHVNSSKKPSSRGVKVYHYPTSVEGQRLAECICQSVNDNVYRDFLREDSIKAETMGENYYILRETDSTGVLIEIGFITNPEDKELITSRRYQKEIALAIKEGIKDYMKQGDIK